MTLQYTVRPISDRTPFPGKHVDSRFDASWSTCLELLERELDFLKARDIVLEVDVTETKIRNDGMLRSDATASSPAVRIAFDSTHGPLTYATDRHRKPSWKRKGMSHDWQHNVYAIALGLEALRKVDRYGIAQRGEQYTGYKAIGAGTGGIALGGMTKEEALALLADQAGMSTPSGLPDGALDPILRRVYRRARAAAHPDRHDGDRSVWNQVEQAAKVLRLS